MTKDSGFVVWLTGMPCSGKSTIAQALASHLQTRAQVEILDGDEFRRELCQELGYSREHRDLNVRRLAYVARLLARNGVGTIVAAVSPYRRARAEARAGIECFLEVHVHCPLSLCETRDVKGMYAKARAGNLSGFTGVSDPYEPPEQPELKLDTSSISVAQAVQAIASALTARGVIR